jgi:hypothetical protein
MTTDKLDTPEAPLDHAGPDELYGGEPPYVYAGEPPHVAGSDTSMAARDEIRESVSVLQGRVLALLAQRPMTDEEMQTAGRFLGNTQRPRRIEMAHLGLVCDSGTRRRTSRGKAAVVWQIHRTGGCSCGYRAPRQTARPAACGPGPAPLVATPSDETIRVALHDLAVLYRASQNGFTPQLVEVAKWLRTITGGKR